MKIIRVLEYTGDADWIRETLTKGIRGRLDLIDTRRYIVEYFHNPDSDEATNVLCELGARPEESIDWSEKHSMYELIYRRGVK